MQKKGINGFYIEDIKNIKASIEEKLDNPT